CQQETSWIFTF
nr:immunoglobulin light chain junction region [Macaca mulatta]MOX27182.1 immunoglobulin light chain junction region [Macaca mulatta]MOX27668.1 immunoglobulin light chain junction region [Macaca mulatta]